MGAVFCVLQMLITTQQITAPLSNSLIVNKLLSGFVRVVFPTRMQNRTQQHMCCYQQIQAGQHSMPSNYIWSNKRRNSIAPVGPYGLSSIAMWLNASILLVATLFSVDAMHHTAPAIVQTKNGQLFGSIESTAIEKRKFHAFRGVRYAKPPIGPLRFRVSKTHRRNKLLLTLK